MEQPRINKKQVWGYREIVSAFGFADKRERVVGVIVTANLAAKSINDEPGARRAVASFMLLARKDPFAAGKPLLWDSLSMHFHF
jgi:hypothetical protein